MWLTLVATTGTKFSGRWRHTHLANQMALLHFSNQIQKHAALSEKFRKARVGTPKRCVVVLSVGNNTGRIFFAGTCVCVKKTRGRKKGPNVCHLSCQNLLVCVCFVVVSCLTILEPYKVMQASARSQGLPQAHSAPSRVQGPVCRQETRNRPPPKLGLMCFGQKVWRHCSLCFDFE